MESNSSPPHRLAVIDWAYRLIHLTYAAALVVGVLAGASAPDGFFSADGIFFFLLWAVLASIGFRVSMFIFNLVAKIVL